MTRCPWPPSLMDIVSCFVLSHPFLHYLALHNQRNFGEVKLAIYSDANNALFVHHSREQAYINFTFPTDHFGIESICNHCLIAATIIRAITLSSSDSASTSYIQHTTPLSPGQKNNYVLPDF